MRRYIVPFAIASALVICVQDAAAQSLSAVSEVIERKTVDVGAPYPVLLREAHAAGDLNSLTTIAKTLLADLNEQHDKFSKECCDPKQHYYEVAFVTRDDKGTEALARILIHDPQPERPVLPGLKGPDEPLYTVFVDESLTVTFKSSFDLERVENPLIKESADFVSGVVGKVGVLASMAIVNRSKAGVTADQSTPLYHTAVTLLRAVFPHGRAKITEKLGVLEPAAYDGVAARAAYLAAVEADRLQSPDTYDKCAGFAAGVAGNMTNALPACGLDKADDACVKALRKAITDAFPPPPTSACPADEALRISRRFLPLAQSSQRLIATTTTLANTPKRWASFSLGTSVVTSLEPKPEEPKAKIASNGNLVVDTFPRLIVEGIVNVMPWGYDPETFSPSWPERIRLNIGFGFAPYLGVSFGGGVAVTRTIALRVARAAVWYDTPVAGKDALNKPPAEPNVDKPLKAVSTGAWLLGVTYAFK